MRSTKFSAFLTATADRLLVTSEVFGSMKTVKLGCWEPAFTSKFLLARTQELKALLGMVLLIFMQVLGHC